MVVEYDRYLREGGEFDKDVVGFDYWRRARRNWRGLVRLAIGVALEREDAPVSWLDAMPTHLVRFMLTLCALIWFEAELLVWALAIWV